MGTDGDAKRLACVDLSLPGVMIAEVVGEVRRLGARTRAIV